MSGGESSPSPYTHSSFDQSDLSGFASAGFNADFLKNGVSLRDGKYYMGDLSMYSDAHGQSDVTDLVNQFNSWKTTVTQHDEYLKAKQQNPGRQGTILVPPESTDASTLLGVDKRNKSLLGV